ncbi:MAG: NrfD/PsrC family molybdoenzyme membrane anchor subunit [candidate division WOR-3 bacterium]
MKEKFEKIERNILSILWKVDKFYIFCLTVSLLMLLTGALSWSYQIIRGIGVSGKTNPVGWKVYITNFVFWVGIAHSGTLISAVLFLLRAKFRSRFNRSAEAMTVFAIMVAGLFPLIHLGRVWKFYWLLPYPNQRHLWINFKSPLIWDVFAVSTYFTVSLIFFYVGMIPDLAVAARYYKDKIRNLFYKILSIGFKGTKREWENYNQLYLYLAAFATPLVVSVHSVVSWDFAMSILPGWHTTIFAPYFVAGAIFSGSAMVITLTVPLRKILKLENYIRKEHFDDLSKILLFTSLIVTYSYIVELYLAFYGENPFEKELFRFRVLGGAKIFFFIMILCNSIMPLSLFVSKLRRNIPYLFVLSIFVNIGMWYERFVIVTSSLSRDYNPYAWGSYAPSLIEIGITIGSFGLFLTLYLIFIKIFPFLSITEIKEEENEIHL